MSRLAYLSRPSVVGQIPVDQHTVIEASAGTGKTFTIVRLVLELIIGRRVPLDQILVVTFAEKAALELRQRIRNALETALSAQPGQNDSGADCWVIDDAVRDRLQQAVRQFDRATIETIHGFLLQVLSDTAFLTGRMLEGQWCDGKALFREAFQTALRRDFARDPKLVPYLRAWLEKDTLEDLESLLYQCCTHKGRLEPRFEPRRIEKAVHNVPRLPEERVLQQWSAALKNAGLHRRTIGAIQERFDIIDAIVEKHAKAVDLPSLLRTDLAERLKYIRDHTRSLQLPSGALKTYLTRLANLDQVLVPFEAAVVHTFLPRMIKSLQQLKLATGQFDFDDIIAQMREAVTGPRAGEVIGWLRQRYRYALLDEFQDTDFWQWEIFKKVFLDSDKGNRLLVIGDPKQAIYGFRGADVAAYLAAKKTILSAGSKPVHLNETYRSTPRLANAINAFFNQSAREPFFSGDIQYDNPVSSARASFKAVDAGGCETPVRVLQVPEEICKAGIAKVREYLGQTIASLIPRLVQNRRYRLRVTGIDQAEVSFRDVFILTATNREAREMGDYLRLAGVPFDYYRQDDLFSTREAADVRDLLAAVVDPADSSKRAKAWLTPFFELGLDELQACGDLPESHPLVRRLLSWQDLAESGRVEQLFSNILNRSGVVRRQLVCEPDQRSVLNYQHIFEILLEEACRRGARIEELLTTLDEFIAGVSSPPGIDAGTQRLAGHRDAVQILTMHKSKGLEAMIVFLFGGFMGRNEKERTYRYHDSKNEKVLFLGKDENAKAPAKMEQEYEHQRLCYVAMTRAKARLYLPYVPPENCKNRMTGPYRLINNRLKALLEQGEVEQLGFRFEKIPSAGRQGHRRTKRAAIARQTREQIDLLLKEPGAEADLSTIREGHLGYRVTSYSALRKAHGDYESPYGGDEFRIDEAAPGEAATGSELPAGVAVGTFLHSVLERMPLDSLKGQPGFQDWLSQPEVSRLFRNQMIRHGVESRHREGFAELVYRALTTPFATVDGTEIPGVASCGRVVREMEFLYPIPEDWHPRLDEEANKAFTIGRGFVRGFVDVIFEHDNRLYFADWKSDSLPGYSAKALRSHVSRNYRLQVAIYSLAVAKLLSVHTPEQYENRFGGMFYLFLRGMRGSGEGVFFCRPTWSRLLEYERAWFAARDVGSILLD